MLIKTLFGNYFLKQFLVFQIKKKKHETCFYKYNFLRLCFENRSSFKMLFIIFYSFISNNGLFDNYFLKQLFVLKPNFGEFVLKIDWLFGTNFKVFSILFSVL